MTDKDDDELLEEEEEECFICGYLPCNCDHIYETWRDMQNDLRDGIY